MSRKNSKKFLKYETVFKENMLLKAFFIKGLHSVVPNIRTLVLLHDILIE